MMSLNQPATALLTATFLVATGAQSALGVDCEALRLEVVGQYAVMNANADAFFEVQARCRATASRPGVQAWEIQQCNQDYQFVYANYRRVHQDYTQAYANYDNLCLTTRGVPRSGPVVTGREAQQIESTIDSFLGGGGWGGRGGGGWGGRGGGGAGGGGWGGQGGGGGGGFHRHC